MKIAIANDHRGYKLKKKLVRYLTKKGYQVLDLGCNSEAAVDYPIYAFELSDKVIEQEADLGIAICGSGIGISIACNKVNGIRCAKPSNVKEVKLSREDNDANILALSCNMPYYRILDIVDAFLNTPYSHIERHQNRIDLITNYEKSRKSTRRVSKKVEKEDTKEDIES